MTGASEGEYVCFLEEAQEEFDGFKGDGDNFDEGGEQGLIVVVADLSPHCQLVV